MVEQRKTMQISGLFRTISAHMWDWSITGVSVCHWAICDVKAEQTNIQTRVIITITTK